jgi:hypothetical protein
VSTFERCQYHCDPGYLPEGEALCLPNATLVGGGCVPAQCKPLAIPHSDRAHGNECTGFTGDECNFTCAKGYRRAQAPTAGPPEGIGPLLCAPNTQEFIGSFAFIVSGAIDATYNGVYVMTNRSCHGRAVWQQQVHGRTAADAGPVLYARSSSDRSTTWILGPVARVEDCSDLNSLIHAANSMSNCVKPRSSTMLIFPDDVVCNIPVTYWSETVPSCDPYRSLAPILHRVPCRCQEIGVGVPDWCYLLSPIRVDRTAVGTDGGDGQQQLCVPVN